MTAISTLPLSPTIPPASETYIDDDFVIIDYEAEDFATQEEITAAIRKLTGCDDIEIELVDLAASTSVSIDGDDDWVMMSDNKEVPADLNTATETKNGNQTLSTLAQGGRLIFKVVMHPLSTAALSGLVFGPVAGAWQIAFAYGPGFAEKHIYPSIVDSTFWSRLPGWLRLGIRTSQVASKPRVLQGCFILYTVASAGVFSGGWEATKLAGWERTEALLGKIALGVLRP